MKGMRKTRSAGSCALLAAAGSTLNLFPNVACSMAFFRVLRPVSVNQTEIRHVAIGMDGGPDAANRMRMRLHEHFQGADGLWLA